MKADEWMMAEVAYLREQVRVLAERIGTLEEVFVLQGVALPREGAFSGEMDWAHMMDGMYEDDTG